MCYYQNMSDKLYIIGNGFDLHHGLKTSYTSFRDNCAKKTPSLWKFMSIMYGDALNNEMWWWNFEEMLGKIDYQHVLESYNGEALGPTIIKNTLRNRIPFSFGAWLNGIEVSAEPDESLSIDSEAFFLTFNYTMVLEKTYGIDNDHVWHIHNSLIDFNKGEKNPIVGHDFNLGQLVGLLEQYRIGHPEIRMDIVNMINDEIANGAKKVKTRIKELEENFYNLFSDVKHFICMGFSFNGIDMPYIEEIIKVNANIQNADWTLYWYSDGEDGFMKSKLQDLGIDENKITLKPW